MKIIEFANSKAFRKSLTMLALGYAPSTASAWESVLAHGPDGSGGELLDSFMPRWQMSLEDAQDRLLFLKNP